MKIVNLRKLLTFMSPTPSLTPHPPQNEENEIPSDGGHYIRSKIDNVDLKKSNLAT